MRLLIFGTGALATLIGARLAHAGHTVTLTGTWRAAIEQIRREGACVREPHGEFVARLAVLDGDQPAPPADSILVLLKSTQTRARAPRVARAASSTTPVFTLQNGLGNAELLTGALGRPVGEGVLTIGARLLGPGLVSASGPGRASLASEPDAPAAEALAAALAESGTPASVVADLRVEQWRKLVANAAINALTALAGVKNGVLLERDDLRAEFEAAAREAGRVAEAAGIELGTDPVAWATTVVRATAENRSSMLQDLERGVPTEVDALNGAVVRVAHSLGRAAPVNERLWHKVRAASPQAPFERGQG